MKKNLALVLVLALVMAVSVVAFAACGGTTYEGEYHYPNTWDNTKPDYGCKVKVTVSNNVITKVELVDSDYVRTSEGWAENTHPGDLGHDKTEAAYANYLKKIEGKTVDEVKGWTATIENVGGATANSVPEAAALTGATQSAARIILAVQNALSKIPAAE